MICLRVLIYTLTLGDIIHGSMPEHDRRLQGTCLSRADHGRVAGALSHGIRDSAVTQDVTHVVTQEIRFGMG